MNGRRARCLILALLFTTMVAPEVGLAHAGGDEVESRPRQTTAGRSRHPRHIPRRRFLRRAQAGGPRLVEVGRVRTGVQPKSVRLSPDGRRVYVANFGMLDRQNVSVFDADDLSLIGHADFPGNAVELAFSPDGATVYVSNFRRHVVEVIDAATLTLRSEIQVGTNPKTLAVSPDGRTLYCANWSDATLSIVDLVASRQVRRVRAGVHPRGVTVLPDGRVLVASFYDDVVRVLSPRGDRLTAFHTCHYPRHLGRSPDASRIWVTCTLGSIGGYDLEDGRRHVFSLTGQNPRTLDVGWGGRLVATANFGSSDVSLLDVETMTRSTVPVNGADKLVGLAFAPGDRGRLYVTSWDTAELVAFEVVPASPNEAPSSSVGNR